ncbi:hypothetical protein MLD38_014846 [Melastoma candidum]|uniref:Uncharacterized protein n=1 Tax=Melastoma candidum TaxID=119954 RepID=A0ACB9RE66_9MYRT|nr:hypothetical protein MLD38_014846 [Melastoma candidum]
MRKGKLILICQHGGEFITNSDCTLSYNGGDANTVDVNQDTLFDDLKLKLAEMFNLQYQSESEIKLADAVETTIVSLPVIERDADAEVACEASQIEVDVGTPADNVKKEKTGIGFGNGVNNDLKKAKRRKLTFRKSFGDLNPETVVGAWKNCITGEARNSKMVFLEILCHCGASSEIFVIKMLIDYRTCNGESWKAAHPAKKWLVRMIKDRLRSSPNHKPKDIANAIFQDSGVKLNYSKVWRGMCDARSQLPGSYKDAYDRLRWFCERIVEANPGSFANLSAGDDGGFRSLFLSFQACIQGFCDGCHGDNGFFPVALAIVDVEDDANWQLFLEQRKSAIPSPHPITFLSDSQKGLKNLMLEAFENGHHAYSIFRLAESFEESMRGPFHGDGKAALLAMPLWCSIAHSEIPMTTSQSVSLPIATEQPTPNP